MLNCAYLAASQDKSHRQVSQTSLKTSRFLCLYIYFFFFWPCYTACGILAPSPRTEPRPQQGESSSNPWTAREFPLCLLNLPSTNLKWSASCFLWPLLAFCVWASTCEPTIVYLLHFFFFFLFYFFFKLYKIVLVLPNIKMNPPQVYMSLAEGVLYYLMMYYRELVFYEAMATFSISLFHFSLLRPFTFLPLHLSFYPLPYFFPSFLCGNMGLNWAK